jgi:hypothetical protein
MTVKFQVGIERLITTMVEVEADSAKAAMEIVDARDFKLPEQNDWDRVKGEEYRVFDERGNEEIEDWD